MPVFVFVDLFSYLAFPRHDMKNATKNAKKNATEEREGEREGERESPKRRLGLLHFFARDYTALHSTTLHSKALHSTFCLSLP